eukprot:Selendium_serpulae@DN10072_c0_g1_i1.p1
MLNRRWGVLLGLLLFSWFFCHMVSLFLSRPDVHVEHPNPSSVYRISVDRRHLPWSIKHWDRTEQTWCARIDCSHPYADHPHLSAKDDFVCLVSPHYKWRHADGCVESATKHNYFQSRKWLTKKCVAIGMTLE